MPQVWGAFGLVPGLLALRSALPSLSPGAGASCSSLVGLGREGALGGLGRAEAAGQAL